MGDLERDNDLAGGWPNVVAGVGALLLTLLVGWGAEPETASRVVELTRRERFAESPKTAHDYLNKHGEAVLS